jgi:uncharacterized membrane protein
MVVRRLLLLLSLFLLVIPVLGQTESVVYAVLFYSPTCPHCHDVMQNVIPEWEDEFGDAIQPLYVNVATQDGSYLFNAACIQLQGEYCRGVPVMAIGETLLRGAGEIPAQGPGLIRDGLAAGGIDLPPVPVLREVFNAEMAASGGAVERTVSKATLADRLAADPTANMMAIAVLIGLVGSFAGVFLFSRSGLLQDQRLTGDIAIAATIVSAALAFSLAINSGEDTLALLLSWASLLLLGFVVFILVRTRNLDLAIPLVAAAGLAVALYLAQVEVSETEAVCGVVGNCNEVQNSEYARLFGILPIGVLGIIGYVLILGAWAVARFSRNDLLIAAARAGLFVMALFGVVFSAYLTFLEPFVIGATCAWCLTSAMTMLVLLWLVAPVGWNAVQQLSENSTPKTA